jgi:putative colanic acid biosynthesis acetyltransferase WcaF
MTIDLSRSNTNWPLRLKLRRGLWTYVLEPLVRWLPKAFSPLRVAALRSMGAHIGPNCLILAGVRVLMPWNLHMEDHVALGECVNIYNFAPVKIKRMTVVSQFTYLCTGSHDYKLANMPLIYEPITIGEQVWVAAGVFVAPGIAIADGVVVGAMSVVSRSPDQAWAVYAGNPCKYLKSRRRPDPISPA